MGLIPSQVKPGTMKLVFQFAILSTKHAVLRSLSEDWLALNWNNMSEWSDISNCELLF
jgi:hypothetical protein